jgi:hypothetical protein
VFRRHLRSSAMFETWAATINLQHIIFGATDEAVLRITATDPSFDANDAMLLWLDEMIRH